MEQQQQQKTHAKNGLMWDDVFIVRGSQGASCIWLNGKCWDQNYRALSTSRFHNFEIFVF